MTKPGRSKVVGLIPAAGRATRLGALPGSKELLPIGLGSDADGTPTAPPASACKVAVSYLLDAFREADIGSAYVVLRAGKWDIPGYLCQGADAGMHLAYVVTPGTASVPETVAVGAPFLYDCTVAFGFPDIVFGPADCFSPLLERLTHSEAQIVLGLVPADEPERCDMVEVTQAGIVTDIVIKRPAGTLRHAWIFAVWTPAFSQFLLERHYAAPQAAVGAAAHEPQLGRLFMEAKETGMIVEGIVLKGGWFVDIGTPQALARAVKRQSFPGTAE